MIQITISYLLVQLYRYFYFYHPGTHLKFISLIMHALMIMKIYTIVAGGNSIILLRRIPFRRNLVHCNPFRALATVNIGEPHSFRNLISGYSRRNKYYRDSNLGNRHSTYKYRYTGCGYVIKCCLLKKMFQANLNIFHYYLKKEVVC